MVNSEHLAKLKEGAEAWNAWRKVNREVELGLRDDDLITDPVVRPDLSGSDLGWVNLIFADLSFADLRGARLVTALEANLRGADLTGSDLRGADLTFAVLTAASLSGARLLGANLTAVNLRSATLTGSDLRVVNLSRADLTGANLAGVNLSRASIGYTTFADNDLSDVKGLETVRHELPSTIGIDTIYRSQGKIPLAFLRGAGVPENFIEYMGSLTGRALEFYSCFISYSTKDQEFAARLHADLQDKGVRCWFASHDIQAGKKIHEQIDAAIRIHERLLLILSPNSMNSEWVKTEIRKARKRERVEKKRVLFPVRLVSVDAIQDWELFDADEGKDLAVEIREYYIPDFSDWKNHDSYAEGLKNLLRDLKAEQPKTA